jgi:hypothetical protein
MNVGLSLKEAANLNHTKQIGWQLLVSWPVGSLALTRKEDPNKRYRGGKKNSLKCAWFADLGRKTVGVVVCLIVYKGYNCLNCNPIFPQSLNPTYTDILLMTGFLVT